MSKKSCPFLYSKYTTQNLTRLLGYTALTSFVIFNFVLAAPAPPMTYSRQAQSTAPRPSQPPVPLLPAAAVRAETPGKYF